MIFTKSFWMKSSERAIKTFAQFFVTLSAAEAINVFTLDWPSVLGLSLGGALLSYATSIVSAGITKKDSPDLAESPVEE